MPAVPGSTRNKSARNSWRRADLSVAMTWLTLWVTLALVIALPLVAFLVAGSPLEFAYPEKGRFNIRGGIEILEVTEVPGGVQVKSKVTIEVQGSEKPACVARVTT